MQMGEKKEEEGLEGSRGELIIPKTGIVNHNSSEGIGSFSFSSQNSQ